MNELQQKRKFTEVLFDPDQPIAFGKDNKDRLVNIPRGHEDFINDIKAEKFCINPVWDWRVTDNIMITSLLFEVDEKGLSPKEQVKLFLKSGLPFSTMTYSGGKSIHVILRFNTKFNGTKWSYQWWFAIARALEKYGIVADPNARLATQLSRVPNTIRELDDGTSKKQTLIYIRNRVDASEVLEWLRVNGEEVKKPVERKKTKYEANANQFVDDTEKWEAAYKFKSKWNGEYNPTAVTGNYMWLFNFGMYCYRVDLSLNASISLSQNKFGIKYRGSNGEGTVEEAITKGWERAESYNMDKIKLISREEYKKLKNLEQLEKISELQNKIDTK